MVSHLLSESSAIVFVLFLQTIYLKWTRNWLMKVREMLIVSLQICLGLGFKRDAIQFIRS